MAKLSYYCCDPKHDTPVQGKTCEGCDLEAIFYGSLPQAVAKLARNKKVSTPNV